MSGMHIVVFAARGRVGQRVCAALHKAGHRVTAITTNPAASAELAAFGYKPCVVDLRQPDTIGPACRDADAVFLATEDAPDQSDVEIGLIRMMANAEVPFVVKLSAQSAGLNPPVSFGKDHIRAERALADSGIAHAVLRPTFFLQSLLLFADDIRTSGKLIAPTGRGKVAMVDVGDIADCATALLTGDRTGASVYTLTGGAAHDFGAVVAGLSSLLGRQVMHISPPAFLARLVLPLKTGMPRWQSNLAVELMTAIRTGAQSTVTSDAETLLGRTPVSLSTFLKQHADDFHR